MELDTITPSIRRTNRIALHMARMPLDDPTHAQLTKIAVTIFTDVVNRGAPFQDALLAIYLSGLQHGATND